MPLLFSIRQELISLGYDDCDIDGLDMVDPAFGALLRQPTLLTPKSEFFHYWDCLN